MDVLPNESLILEEMKKHFGKTPYGSLHIKLSDFLCEIPISDLFIKNMKAVIDIAHFLGMSDDVFDTLLNYIMIYVNHVSLHEPLGISLHRSVIEGSMFSKLLHGGIYIISGENIIITVFFIKYCFQNGQKVRIQKKIPNFFKPLGYVIKKRSCSTNLLVES